MRHGAAVSVRLAVRAPARCRYAAGLARREQAGSHASALAIGASCGLDTAVRTGTEVLLRQRLILWAGAGFLLNEAQIIETIRV